MGKTEAPRTQPAFALSANEKAMGGLEEGGAYLDVAGFAHSPMKVGFAGLKTAWRQSEVGA